MATNDNYSGTRMLPSAATFAKLTPEQVRRVCYTTQANRDFPGRKPAQEHIGENYVEVHGIGQRKSKYLDFQLKTAPLLNRTACRHNQAYGPLPLGDNVVNRALATSFKEGFKAGVGSNPCPLDGSTAHEEQFPLKDSSTLQQDLKFARQKSKKPKAELTFTVCPPGNLLETKSHEQRQFSAPQLDLKSEPVKPPVPCHYIGGSAQRIFPPTATKQVHNLKAVRREKSSSSPNLGLTPMAPMDEEILRRPRNIYMEPAK
eukprot:TRINITY_DN38135_c0_g1_i1.p1 TRINITY_DN38135_c0_g1~~TRINITY_DN38135_c0_g1_i1.p1  ORF type:complete len:278 (-),score=60.70 TRINITY_DN38135_c0_g1_i1:123-899(-)